jgi:hypothetical protein
MPQTLFPQRHTPCNYLQLLATACNYLQVSGSKLPNLASPCSFLESEMHVCPANIAAFGRGPAQNKIHCLELVGLRWITLDSPRPVSAFSLQLSPPVVPIWPIPIRIELLRHFSCGRRRNYLFTPISSDLRRFTPIQPEWRPRKSDQLRAFGDARPAAGLNICVTSAHATASFQQFVLISALSLFL